jgi:thioesterase domain-containing protein
MANYRVNNADEFPYQHNLIDRITDAARAAIAPGTQGDRYLLTDGPNINKIAYISVPDAENPTWVYLTPLEGWQCWINDENEVYRFDGTNWAIFKGQTGATGATGNTGATGATGNTGATGATGQPTYNANYKMIIIDCL